MVETLKIEHLLLSKRLFSEARLYIPGGVNSPVRSFQAVGGYPIFVNHAKGSKIYSECGREFIDYCLCFGALILGHTHPRVGKELKKAVDRGASFGIPTKSETALAKLITEAIPSIEKIRLTNSGTEAVMSAIRLSRAYTGKDKIIKFEGSYHGHADYLFSKNTLVAPYNNIKKVTELLEKHKKDIAAIIVEPVAGNMGVVLPQGTFLPRLKIIASKYNIVLIFDEVITGFRLSYGGAQGLFKIKPDLTCLGKIIGGGLPIGALGGRREIMDLLAPEGQVYQAGTFSGNPVSVTAGLTTLRLLSEYNPYHKLEKLTQKFCQRIKEIAKEYGFKIEINYIGSMFSIFFTDQEVTDYRSASTQNKDLFKKFYHRLLKEGIYLSPSGLETNFLSTAHTTGDIEKTLKAIERCFENLGGI